MEQSWSENLPSVVESSILQTPLSSHRFAMAKLLQVLVVDLSCRTQRSTRFSFPRSMLVSSAGASCAGVLSPHPLCLFDGTKGGHSATDFRGRRGAVAPWRGTSDAAATAADAGAAECRLNRLACVPSAVRCCLTPSTVPALGCCGGAGCLGGVGGAEGSPAGSAKSGPCAWNC